jgi:hypothetical protein
MKIRMSFAVITFHFDPTFGIYIYYRVCDEFSIHFDRERFVNHWVHDVSFVSGLMSYFVKAHVPCGKVTLTRNPNVLRTMPTAPA